MNIGMIAHDAKRIQNLCIAYRGILANIHCTPVPRSFNRKVTNLIHKYLAGHLGEPSN